MPSIRITTVAVAIALLTATTAPTTFAVQTSDPLKQSVEQTLREDRALRRLEVSVEGDQVTLTGTVRTFWEKNEALRRTFDVAGVDAVVSEIEVPLADDQGSLAEDVVKAIRQYPHYRIWDQIDGALNEGVVTLTGRVTPERDKVGELFERIAKVRGVQGVQMNIETLPPSLADERLRIAISRRLFASEHFERFRSMNNPPFHIVVHNSVVTLVGYVQGDIEHIEMERIVGQTQGVLRVENRLESLR